MGLLPDTPAPPAAKPGKLQRIYLAMDDDDRAALRSWAENPGYSLQTICDELNKHDQYAISYAAFCRGLADLRESDWEA